MNMAKAKTKSKHKTKSKSTKKGRRRGSKKKQQHIGFTKAIKRIKKQVIKKNPNTLGDAIKIALKSAKSMTKKKIKSPRIIKVPKTGGILPLIPIFAGLSALGTLSGGAAAIAKSVNDARSAKQQLEEAKRHHRKMESVAVGGRGLYLRPYKTGLGLFLRPPSKNY